MKGELDPQEALAPRVVYLAEVEASGLKVGLVAGHLTRRLDCQGELEWLDVLTAHRRTGIASELLRMLARWFGERRVKRVCVDVAPDNAPAQAFYRKYGAEDLRPHWLVWPDIRVPMARRLMGPS
jgi:ribosomal protein S18 acetylase RimI-like enzyme